MSTGYSAQILADSVGPHGIRLTTMEVTFPRAYLSEFNTHRVLSRNSESSRAIPTELQIERVMQHPYIPEFAKRVKGMGVGVPLEGAELEKARLHWLLARDEAVSAARGLLGVAKDQANRLLEPFMWHTVIVSATEWENFLNLRDHEAAAPPMQKIASMMRYAMSLSVPDELGWGDWHLPLVGWPERRLADLSNEYGAQVSAGRCARSSYSNHRKPETANESKARWDSLAAAGHWSPAEHPCRVMTEDEWNASINAAMELLSWKGDPGWDVRQDAIDRLSWCGNFDGWIQLRKTYEDEAIFRG